MTVLEGAMDLTLAVYALVTGGMTAFNPCGMAMLPAYLGYVLAGTASEGRRPIGKAFRWGGAVAVGCVGLFLGVALVLALGLRTLTRWAPVLGLGVGVGLILLAGAQWAGRSVPFPRIPVRASGRGRSWGAAVGFGVAYGLASMGCALPLFLAGVGVSLVPARWEQGLVLLGLYTLGLGGVLVGLALGVALLGTAAVRRARHLAGGIERLGALLMLGSGVYLVYYWTLGPGRLRFF